MISPTDRYHFELILRFNQVLRSLNFSINEWLCNCALATSDRSISENSLALILGLPRTTVRTYVEDGVAKGFFSRDPELGVEITPHGRILVEEITHQGLEIALGRQSGFSREIVTTLGWNSQRSLKAKNRNKSLEEAENITFTPPLIYPVEN